MSVTRLLAALLALAALAAPAAACPTCSLAQGVDTLLYIIGFMLVPYLLVSGTWWWMKRILAAEAEELT